MGKRGRRTPWACALPSNPNEPNRGQTQERPIPLTVTKPAVLPAPQIGLLDGATVFLDIDGTLLDLDDDPEAVRADEDTRALLQDLAQRMDGRLAMVSGRSLEQIQTELVGEKSGK